MNSKPTLPARANEPWSFPISSLDYLYIIYFFIFYKFWFDTSLNFLRIHKLDFSLFLRSGKLQFGYLQKSELKKLKLKRSLPRENESKLNEFFFKKRKIKRNLFTILNHLNNSISNKRKKLHDGYCI